MARTLTIERLGPDLVTMARCMVIDADAFPHASAWFGSRSPSEPIWVATEPEGAGVLGFLAARVRGDALHVQGIAVDRPRRGRGVGRALLRTAVASAIDLAAVAVVLCVSVTNRPAVGLYESEGFVVTRRLRDYYPARAFGGARDALEMMRPLAP